MKRLVLLVEGDGDVEAVPLLVKKLLAELQAFDQVSLDPNPLRVGEYVRIARQNYGEWHRYLGVAAKRRNIGGCLLLLDGDSPKDVDRQLFCAKRAALRLAEESRKAGGRTLYSVAVVFPCQEYESWLIAGANSLAGKTFSDGRSEISQVLDLPPGDLEVAPRDAKGWFRKVMKSGYKPVIDQAELTKLVELEPIRQRGMRSFRRLENALRQLVQAIRDGHHVVTPFPISDQV